MDTVMGLTQSPDPLPEEELEERMSEVELRLEKAFYYRMLLKQNPFDSDSDIADEVWKDISKLLRNRLAELLGIVAPAAAPGLQVFTNEEVTILKSIVSKVQIAANGKLTAKVKKTPSLKRVSMPEESKREAPVLRIPREDKPQAPAAKPAPGTKTGGRSKVGAPRKVFKTVTDGTGQEVQMDITPQAQPVGIKPVAMPDTNFTNAHAAAQAAEITAKSDLAGIIDVVKA